VRQGQYGDAKGIRAADPLARASIPMAIKNVCDKLRTTLFFLAYAR
jgi:hypothetical protein